MRRPSRSRLLAAAVAAAVTVPALAVPATAGTAARRTFMDIWGRDTGDALGPWAGMGDATIPVPLPIAARTVRSAQTGCDDGYVLTTAGQILAPRSARSPPRRTPIWW